jgi:hypothetical protein
LLPGDVAEFLDVVESGLFLGYPQVFEFNGPFAGDLVDFVAVFDFDVVDG